jgi:hypothetical protein
MKHKVYEYSISFELREDEEGFKVRGVGSLRYRGGGSGLKGVEERVEKICESEVVEKVGIVDKRVREEFKKFFEREYGLRGEIEFDIEYKVGCVDAIVEEREEHKGVEMWQGSEWDVYKTVRIWDEEKRSVMKGLLSKGIESLVV